MQGIQPLAETFYFERFSITPRGVDFLYTTDAGHSFTHTVEFRIPPESVPALESAVFALGMAELSHYWKAILAPRIVIRAGALTDSQKRFWENLYLKGLGEFFYVNGIDFRGILQVEHSPDAPLISPTWGASENKILVPFGGGKDSLVTGEMLKKIGKNFSWFELEPLPFGKKLMELSGVTKTVAFKRDVGKNFAPILDLVRKGAPNGHVPITATYIFSATVAAKAFGYTDIALSLERSADFGNVEYLGTVINHQYSKSFEFESAAAEYVTTYVDPNIKIFSLLRPLYELQIIKEFTAHQKYFYAFVSCNRGLKSSSWCGECAKCAFMFAGLSAFLPPHEVVSIFGKNLFQDEKLIPLYRDMIGKGSMKPFDCVGTFEENLLALYLSAGNYKKAGIVFPVVLASLPIEEGAQHTPLLEAFGEHAIPLSYQSAWIK